MHDEINKEYFEWLYRLVCENRYDGTISYRKLLTYLHNADFRYSIAMDENRAEDGLDLRHRFACEYTYEDDAELYLEGPCSVLEMIIALAIRCEETYMDDANIGDRTAQWFWKMITNLGLGSMYDTRFDSRFVYETVERFLNRDYEPDGIGGLFIVKNCDCDLRTVEIWHQLCWYLNSIT